MSPAIHTLSLGIANAFVLRDQGAVLVDCGPPQKVDVFVKQLSTAGIEPRQIKLIIITHGHWDHIGSAAEIKQLTGAQILMHQQERKWLEDLYAAPPQGVGGWGRFLAKTMAAVMAPFIRVPSAAVDIGFETGELSLEPYGIAGRIVHTPGHTIGSLSVLLDSGEAIVGDMAMNSLPMRLSPGLPVFAENLSQLMESWRMLLRQDIQTIYPSHGGPFSPDVMRRAVS